MSYNIYEKVQDGQLNGPRFELLAIKLATHAGAAFAIACLIRNVLLAAWLGGPAIYAIVIARKWYLSAKTRTRPNWIDELNDLLFPFIIVAGGLIYERNAVGVILLVVCISLWFYTRRYSTP